MATTEVLADRQRAATEDEVEELAGRVFMAGLGAVELYTVHLGRVLGLYEALDVPGWSTVDELADRTGLARRYVREWLQSQAISGFVQIDGDDVDTGRYTLAPGVRETLIQEASPAYVGSIPGILPVVGQVVPALAEAFRTGEGVPYAAYGEDAVGVQEGMNRPDFEHSLVAEWLPQVPDVLDRLRDSANPVVVVDACCGTGWSSIVLAEAFEHITVRGLDNDEDSIARARRTAAERGVSDRVTFEVRDIIDDDLVGDSRCDVAFVFEALHDLPRPVEALTNLRRSLSPGAPLVLMEEGVGDQLVAPGDEVERFLAAASTVWCTPQGHGPGAEVVGAIMRPHVLEDLAHQAGFTHVDALPIEHPIYRFYRLTT